MSTNEFAEKSPRRLQIVKIRGVAYFVDVRLREIRQVVRSGSWKTIRFESEEAEKLLWSKFFLFDCPRCLEPVLLSDKEEPVICTRCGQDVREALRSLVKGLGQ